MARLYQFYCPACEMETSWIHDDMSLGSTPDRCRKCGNDYMKAYRVAAERDRMRCGCHKANASFWDDEPGCRYEIILCHACGATWAYDYDPVVGNVEPGSR